MFFHCTLRDEAVDGNWVGLTDAVGAGLGLKISLGVPIGFEHDDFRGGSEIEAKATSTGRDEHDLVFGVVVEEADGEVAAGASSGPVQAAEFEFGVGDGLHFKEVFAYVQHFGKTGKDEDFLLLVDAKLLNEFVEENEFGGSEDEGGGTGFMVVVVRLGVGEEEGVVAALNG